MCTASKRETLYKVESEKNMFVNRGTESQNFLSFAEFIQAVNLMFKKT